MSWNYIRRSSGFHFADANQSSDVLPYLQEQHPDLTVTNVNGSALHRNKTERRRLQGLQRAQSNSSAIARVEEKTLQDVFNIWLINEGGRQLFFGVWVILHLLVAILGLINYELKDSYENARALFGVTFRTFQHFAINLDSLDMLSL